jgi:hypothetical protein
MRNKRETIMDINQDNAEQKAKGQISGVDPALLETQRIKFTIFF